MTFEEAGFPSYLFSVLMKQGFAEPTPIQAQGWPMAMSGRDFVGIAQTGSGKTIGVSLAACVVGIDLIRQDTIEDVSHWVSV